ncbi:hypothetical protein YC2023_094196 [Brassica napus]
MILHPHALQLGFPLPLTHSMLDFSPNSALQQLDLPLSSHPSAPLYLPSLQDLLECQTCLFSLVLYPLALCLLWSPETQLHPVACFYPKHVHLLQYLWIFVLVRVLAVRLLP